MRYPPGMAVTGGVVAQLLTSGKRAHEIAAIAVLIRSGALPVEKLASLVDHLGSAVEALTLLDEQRLPPFLAAQMTWAGVTADSVERAVGEAESWLASGLDIRTVLDSAYPPLLHSIFNRPPMLFVAGTWDQQRDYSSVAVVGTRRASQAGLRRARRLVKELAAAGYTIISGLALGIDTAAHEAALAHGARTVAVLGSGLRRVYPATNRALAERIVATGGALLSQFFPDQPPAKWTFPKRNVVMSGLSLATVVIEAGETSGAKMQARIALEHGRSVFLLSSLVAEHDWAKRYVQEGAHSTHAVEVGSPRDILDRLDGRIPAAAALAM
jgi:DNA processing protein